ncbi:hypothetical protein BC937DRAFT_91785 [Endogone sp. FLAS-F59071]|nr:hypothetical protein BC937DRAFT_91785 [Endogone sp. FLAS-F59071]|eukprot:RUS21699.1 hypothetical protein BC937DRAFT_91785 [Endogone sp. FLAS-F59071]
MGTLNAPFNGPKQKRAKEKRVQKQAFKSRRLQSLDKLIHNKPLSKKKQQQIETSLKHELKRLTAAGKYVPEEEMIDAFALSSAKSTKSVELSPDILALSAAGPGTTLGAPQQ